MTSAVSFFDVRDSFQDVKTPKTSTSASTVGWSPKCYIPSFMKIGLPVLEKKIFEWFLPYMGVAAILVM